MICLDSSFLIDFLRNKKEAVEKISALEESFGISAVSVFEVMLGFYLDNADNSKKSEKFKELVENTEVLNLDLNSAILSSKISSDLSRKGEKIDELDCLIAGTMLSNEVNTILTGDKRHFGRIAMVKVISY